MSTRRSPRLPSARPLPTRRAPVPAQVAIVGAVCRAVGPFSAREQAAATEVAADKAQLVMAFWRACGLVERAPGRGMYRPTKVAMAMASAWQEGLPQGLLALRGALRPQWFVKSARTRLAQGPGLREGVVAKLMRQAQVGKEYRLEVDTLVELMIEIGMLVPQADGYLGWYEQPQGPPLRDDATAFATVTADSTDEEHTVPDASNPLKIPEPRAPVAEPAADVEGEDLVALLSRPLRLADLARLSPEDLLTLHGHLAGLADAAAKLRSRPSDAPTD